MSTAKFPRKKPLQQRHVRDAITRTTGLEPLAPPTDAEREEEGSGSNGTKREPRRFTELGNAMRLLDAHRGDIRYSPALGFCTWTEGMGGWRVNDALTVCKWAQDTIVALYREAGLLAARAAELAATDQEEAKARARLAEALLKWAKASQRSGMVASMLTLIQPHVRIEPTDFDTHKSLFNCANGTLNLETGELQPHRRADYLTQRSPIAYNPGAECPRFERFLDEVTLGRQGLRDYLLRVLAYALTGDTSAQLWHLLLGKGENGKTTLMELIAYIWGDYATNMEPESVTVTHQARDGSAPSPDIARLRGKRLTRITETEEGARLAAQRVKKFCGEDTLTGRFLHKDPFEFTPVHKLFIYTNHKPLARDTTHAFWRRVRVIPFELDLEKHPEMKDPKLPEALRAEAEGILALLVRKGLKGYQERGLTPPEEVVQATTSYRNAMDVVALFLSERCELGEGEGYEVRGLTLYVAYSAWMEEVGEHPLSKRRFSDALTEKGYATRDSHGTIWLGIKLPPPATEAPTRTLF